MLRRRQQAAIPGAAEIGIVDEGAAQSSATNAAQIVSGRTSKSPVHQSKMEAASERSPLLNVGDGQTSSPSLDNDSIMAWSRRNQWIIFAMASGACAALNGVMAKLTTTELTTSLSQGIARMLGLSAVEGTVEAVVRGGFFGLNLFFNGVMWTLFTQALSRGHSTTQVSIMNTSSNFVITALLGLVIFSESLPPLWWLGASMLVAGNVIIGRKDESVAPAADVREEDAISEAESGRSDYEPAPSSGDRLSPEVKADEDDVPDLGDLDER